MDHPSFIGGHWFEGDRLLGAGNALSDALGKLLK
jgi:hypothetical protein